MDAQAASSHARAIVERLDVTPTVEAVAVSFANTTAPAILESSLANGSYGRFSIFACEPVETLLIRRAEGQCPFTVLAERARRWPTVPHADRSFPFIGGWIGFFSYESGLGLEGLHSTAPDEPGHVDTRFCLYDSAAVLDHQTETWYAVAVDWPAPIAVQRPPAGQRLVAIQSRLEEAASFHSLPESVPSPIASRPSPNMSREAYFKKIARAKRHIEAGDIYEVNLTQRFSVETPHAPLDVYRSLRRANPSAYAALIAWGDRAVISSSPELFLDLRNGRVVTRPIKGTRPRGGNTQDDDRLRRELATSEKDMAELTMIVDLLRNDLGRVCSFGSVRVESPGEIETHPTVLHRVATIEGRLRPDASWVDLLQASFPGGSITGAPKIRAMRIIDELEPTRRGVYCGSIGYLGLDGSLCLNIAIRTMFQVGSRVHVHAGGAIVADSEPEEEYEEIMAKARGMFQALGCGEPQASACAVFPRGLKPRGSLPVRQVNQ